MSRLRLIGHQVHAERERQEQREELAHALVCAVVGPLSFSCSGIEKITIARGDEGEEDAEEVARSDRRPGGRRTGSAARRRL